MTGMRCWLCGVATVRVTPSWVRYPDCGRVPVGWPGGDHEHSATPPTPAELLAGGDAAMGRIIDAWAGR